jgi:hypothetical protein
LSRSAVRGSFWPNAAHRALLQVALGPAGEAAARWRALQPLEVTELDTGGFALLPLLHDRLSAVVPDEPQLPRLAGTYRSVWYRNRLLLDRLGTLLPLLRADKVDAILVGGAAVLLRYYARPGLRPVPELELAIASSGFERAVAAAAGAGWQPLGVAGPSIRLRDDEGRMLGLHPGLPPWVAGPAGRDGAYQALRARALELAGTEVKPIVLDPGDDLLFVCATGARTVAPPSCQWLVDAHHILRSGELPPASELLARAERLRLVEPLRATVAYLADVVGREGLEELLSALEAHAPPPRDRVAFRLAGIGGTRLVGPAQTLAVHLQATADQPLRHLVTRLPRTLQESWGARSLPEMSALALRKTARVLRPAAQARSRSASS